MRRPCDFISCLVKRDRLYLRRAREGKHRPRPLCMIDYCRAKKAQFDHRVIELCTNALLDTIVSRAADTILCAKLGVISLCRVRRVNSAVVTTLKGRY